MNSSNTETNKIIDLWTKDGLDFGYYQKAESEDWLKGFWDKDSTFVKFFNKLNLENTLEIACGAGRHSEQIIQKCGHLWLLDTSEAALEIANKRLKPNENFSVLFHPSGFGIPEDVPGESLTAIFSYDAMVHFEYDCIISYIQDSYRKLKSGGMCLFHHSNYDKNPGGTIHENPSWRNFMSQGLFIHIAKRAGFKLIQSEVFAWTEKDTDCLTLLQK